MTITNQTHLLDHTLVPAEYDKVDHPMVTLTPMLMPTRSNREQQAGEAGGKSTYPLHAIEF